MALDASAHPDMGDCTAGRPPHEQLCRVTVGVGRLGATGQAIAATAGRRSHDRATAHLESGCRLESSWTAVAWLAAAMPSRGCAVPCGDLEAQVFGLLAHFRDQLWLHVAPLRGRLKSPEPAVVQAVQSAAVAQDIQTVVRPCRLAGQGGGGGMNRMVAVAVGRCVALGSGRRACGG